MGWVTRRHVPFDLSTCDVQGLRNVDPTVTGSKTGRLCGRLYRELPSTPLTTRRRVPLDPGGQYLQDEAVVVVTTLLVCHPRRPCRNTTPTHKDEWSKKDRHL